jgi:predicted DNA-binding transcriptional regulator YafY
MKFSNAVSIDYTNWKGARRVRKILPMSILFGSNQYHPGEQWLLEAADLEDNDAIKTFSMKDIHSWTHDIVDESKNQIIDKWPFKGDSNAGA